MRKYEFYFFWPRWHMWLKGYFQEYFHFYKPLDCWDLISGCIAVCDGADELLSLMLCVAIQFVVLWVSQSEVNKSKGAWITSGSCMLLV